VQLNLTPAAACRPQQNPVYVYSIRMALFLSDSDVFTVGVTPAAAIDIVQSVLRARDRGSVMQPRLSVPGFGTAAFQVTVCTLAERNVSGAKWVCISANETQPHISGVVVLNDATDGTLRAIVDARSIIALRAAAETALAARHLARADSTVAGFLACGQQARAHLEALQECFPLARVRAYSRTTRSADAFVAFAGERGLDASVASDPRDVVSGSDLVISSVPYRPETAGLFAGEWIRDGTFVAFVDLGATWRFAKPCFDYVVTDDRALTNTLVASGRMVTPQNVDAQLSELIGSPNPVDASITAFYQCGVALGDLAIADFIVRTAIDRRIGTTVDF
jgi:alanine dehydrogenase